MKIQRPHSSIRNFKLLTTKVIANFKEEEFIHLSKMADTVDDELFSLFDITANSLFDTLLYIEQAFNLTHYSKTYITLDVIKLKFIDNLQLLRNSLMLSIGHYGINNTRFWISYFSFIYDFILTEITDLINIKNQIDKSDLNQNIKDFSVTRFDFFKETSDILILSLTKLSNIIYELDGFSKGDYFLTLDEFELKIHSAIIIDNVLVSDSMSRRALLFTKMNNDIDFKVKNTTSLDISNITLLKFKSKKVDHMLCEHLCTMNNLDSYNILISNN